MAVSSVSKAKPAMAPKTLDILIKAVQELDDRKGVSIPAIKTYILTNYPDKDRLKLKTSLKKAIEKGFQDELLVRPKSSETQGSGMTGRLKINKAKMAGKEKSEKLKEKKKAALAEKKATAKPATKKPATKAAAATKPKPKAVKKTPTKTKKSPAKTKKTKEAKTPVKKTKKDAKAPKTVEKVKPMKTPKTPMKAKQTKSAKAKGKA